MHNPLQRLLLGVSGEPGLCPLARRLSVCICRRGDAVSLDRRWTRAQTVRLHGRATTPRTQPPRAVFGGRGSSPCDIDHAHCRTTLTEGQPDRSPSSVRFGKIYYCFSVQNSGKVEEVDEVQQHNPLMTSKSSSIMNTRGVNDPLLFTGICRISFITSIKLVLFLNL